jgi:hypothetical protein
LPFKELTMHYATAPFPDTYRSTRLETLLHAYESAPRRLRQALDGLSDDHLRAHPRPGKWSILEIALHVTDSEVVGAGRFRLAYAESGASFTGYDQAVWAQMLRYNEAPLSRLHCYLTLFEGLRVSAADIFRRTAPAEWERFAIHPERGPMTLRNLLELYADHGDRHIQQILLCRELLGVPTQVEIVLPERLY